MRIRECCTIFVVLLSVAASAAAQVPVPDSTPLTPGLLRPRLWEFAARRAANDTGSAANDSMSDEHATHLTQAHVAGRMGAGLLGAGVGALGVGALGYAFLPEGHCACEDPGLRRALVAAAVGAVAGAALAAALPKQDSRCSYGRRVLYGVLGGVAGGALGFIAPNDHGRAVFIPVGAGLGAGVVSSLCSD